jgi:hypothetical protein
MFESPIWLSKCESYLLLHWPVLHDALHTLAHHRAVLNLSEGLLAAHLLTNAAGLLHNALLLGHHDRDLGGWVYGWKETDSKDVRRQGSVCVSAPRCHGLWIAVST